MSADKQIADILSRFGEDMNTNTWLVPGGKARAIKHPCIERMAAQAGVVFDMPEIVSSAPDNVVIIVTGKMGERIEWSFGEAAPKNNKNSYPFAMAEKRGKDRVALKLIGLHGLLYSEEEADDFKQARAPEPVEAPKSAYAARKDGDWPTVEKALDRAAGSLEKLCLFTTWIGTRNIPAAWHDEAVEAWGKALGNVIANECHTPTHVDKWLAANEVHLKGLPPVYGNEAFTTASRLRAEIRQMLEREAEEA